MRVIVMDRISFAIRSLSDVTSITYNDGTITVQGVNDESPSSGAITLTTTSARSIVRIMEN